MAHACDCLPCSTLQQVVEGCGSSFASHVTSSLLELLFSALGHTNRFVRETGYKVLAAIVTCPGEGENVQYTLQILKLYCVLFPMNKFFQILETSVQSYIISND